MGLVRKIDARNRLAATLASARTNGAEMVSVAFPPFPYSAFERLARSAGSALFFFFENEKKHIAESALDFRTPFFPKVSLKNLSDAFPRIRETLSFDNSEPRVPAPKIFVAGTFDETEAPPLAVLPTWQISRFGENTRICAHFFLADDFQAQTDSLVEDYARIAKLAETDEDSPANPIPEVSPGTEVGGDGYLPRAAHAIAEINAGKFEKIVLARARDFYFDAQQSFPAGTLCRVLRRDFLKSGCTIFSARTNAQNAHEKIVGASPEMLALLRDGHLETEALAGTAARRHGSEQAGAEILFSDAKERREHQLVVDFIAEKLRSLGLTPFFPETPGILALPNVLHLHTPVSADVPEQSVSLGEIVAALHPTPAMCGVPADKAKNFILENEAFPRENFSAPVGFIDADGNGFFAVAIRCAKIFADKIRLYAGSGLVCGSVPEKEFSEINAKISALASRIRTEI